MAASARNLERELFPLRHSKRQILHVELYRIIAALQVDRRLRRLTDATILDFSFFRSGPVGGGWRDEREARCGSGSSTEGGSIPREILE